MCLHPSISVSLLDSSVSLFLPLMVMEEVDGGNSFSAFGFPIIGILSAAIMLLIYYCILVRWRNPGNSLSLPSHQLFPPHGEGKPSGIDNPFIQLIPAYKHGKVAGKFGEGENICSVCLCEFKEGEDVRRLPDCLHSFHAPCIDMWLYSHSNCPLCRAEMKPSPLLPLRRSPPPNAGGLPRIGSG